MVNLTIPSKDTTEVDLSGKIDADNGVEYLGVAKKQPDGKWHVLANVSGKLCLVEVSISPIFWNT